MNNDIPVLPLQRLSRLARTPKHPILPMLSALIIVSTSILTLCAQEQSGSFAAGSDVASIPTLPAATVDHIFASMGSPMVGTGAAVEQTARATGIDDAFALAVWWAETNDGEAGVGSGDRNPGSVRGTNGYPSDYDGYTIYPTYNDAITDWFHLLRNNYVNQGYTNVYAISGRYVGTAGAGNWAAKVVNLMTNYHQEAPPLASSAPPPPTGPQPKRLLIDPATTGTPQTRPQTTEQPTRPIQPPQQSSANQVNTRYTQMLRERREFEWSDTSSNEHATIPTRAAQPAVSPVIRSQPRVNDISNANEHNQAITIFNDFQLPITGVLLSMIVIVLLANGRRSRNLLSVAKIPITTLPVESPVTGQLIGTGNEQDPFIPQTPFLTQVPPTPRLAASISIPLTPIIHSRRTAGDTEGFMIPRSLRTTRLLKVSDHSDHSDAVAGIKDKANPGLALPVQSASEVGIVKEGLLSRYGDKKQKN